MIVKHISDVVNYEALIPLNTIKPVLGVDWEEDDAEIESIRTSSIERVSEFVKYPVNSSDVVIILDLVNYNKDPDRIRAGFDVQKMPINSITRISRCKDDGTEEDLSVDNYNFNSTINHIHFSNKMQHKKEGFTKLFIYCNVGWSASNLPDEIRKSIYSVAIEAYDKPDFPKSNSLLSPATSHKFWN